MISGRQSTRVDGIRSTMRILLSRDATLPLLELVSFVSAVSCLILTGIVSPRPQNFLQRSISPTHLTEAMYTCLFLPYLHFDTYKRLVRRREMILERIHQGRSRPIPEHVVKSDSLELQVIWEYLGHDPPINCRRTIDQYGYPSLRDTRARDDDQMLYKLTKERGSVAGPRRGLFSDESSGRAASDKSGGSGGWKDRFLSRDAVDYGVAEDAPEEDKLLDGNVLVVDQLWLWVINSRKFIWVRCCGN